MVDVEPSSSPSPVNTLAYSRKILSASLFSAAVPGKSSSSTPLGKVLVLCCCAVLIGVCEDTSWRSASSSKDTTTLLLCMLNANCSVVISSAGWTIPWHVLGFKLTPRLVGLINWMVKHDLDVSTSVVATWSLPFRGVLRGSTTVFVPQDGPVTSTFTAECGGIQTALLPATSTSPSLLGFCLCLDEVPALPFSFSSPPTLGSSQVHWLVPLH